MAPQYKLTYFNVKALGEPIRLLFAQAGVEYEDVRITHEDWPTLKSTMPWNVLPVLEVDGKQLSQSLTILRYLGRKFGLNGSNEFETAKCDEYVDAMTDVRLEVHKILVGEKNDESKKAEGMKKLKEEVLPKFFKKISEILKNNGGKYLVGNKITYADIYVAFMIEFITGPLQATDLFQESPELVAHRDLVFGQPGIKAWITKRPVTEF